MSTLGLIEYKDASPEVFALSMTRYCDSET